MADYQDTPMNNRQLLRALKRSIGGVWLASFMLPKGCVLVTQCILVQCLRAYLVYSTANQNRQQYMTHSGRNQSCREINDLKCRPSRVVGQIIQVRGVRSEFLLAGVTSVRTLPEVFSALRFVLPSSATQTVFYSSQYEVQTRWVRDWDAPSALAIRKPAAKDMRAQPSFMKRSRIHHVPRKSLRSVFSPPRVISNAVPTTVVEKSPASSPQAGKEKRQPWWKSDSRMPDFLSLARQSRSKKL
jgi:hypothetical protein